MSDLELRTALRSFYGLLRCAFLNDETVFLLISASIFHNVSFFSVLIAEFWLLNSFYMNLGLFHGCCLLIVELFQNWNNFVPLKNSFFVLSGLIQTVSESGILIFEAASQKVCHLFSESCKIHNFKLLFLAARKLLEYAENCR